MPPLIASVLRAAGAIAIIALFLFMFSFALVVLEPPEAERLLDIAADIALLLTGIVIGRALR